MEYLCLRCDICWCLRSFDLAGWQDTKSVSIKWAAYKSMWLLFMRPARLVTGQCKSTMNQKDPSQLFHSDPEQNKLRMWSRPKKRLQIFRAKIINISKKETLHQIFPIMIWFFIVHGHVRLYSLKLELFKDQQHTHVNVFMRPYQLTSSI